MSPYFYLRKSIPPPTPLYSLPTSSNNNLAGGHIWLFPSPSHPYLDTSQLQFFVLLHLGTIQLTMKFTSALTAAFLAFSVRADDVVADEPSAASAIELPTFTVSLLLE